MSEENTRAGFAAVIAPQNDGKTNLVNLRDGSNV